MKTLKSPVIYNASCLFRRTDKPLYLAGIFNMSKEIWKDVVGYEGIYQVSNLGRVKSLSRILIDSRGGVRTLKEIIRANTINDKGYPFVTLRKNSKTMTKTIHLLMAEAFLGHKPSRDMFVDHIDNNKRNNNLLNLQVITPRENNSKDTISSSKYTGVSWHKKSKKWVANIKIKGKCNYLGLFDCELKASIAYQKALKQITNGK